MAGGCAEADVYESPDKSITGRGEKRLVEKGRCIKDSLTDTSARQWGDLVAKGDKKKYRSHQRGYISKANQEREKERITEAKWWEGEIRKEKGKDCPQMEPSTGAGEAHLLKIRDREAT